MTKLKSREEDDGDRCQTGKEMEGEKRKSEFNDAVLKASQKRARWDENGEEETTTVTDEEVEEFFAILKRIHVAVNYFKKVNGDVRSLTELEKAESLNWGRNAEVDGGEKEENVGLDLNADPGTGSDPF
ncbi:PREDICTED: protein NIM1-INTERACTING 2 [Theobroma cacao]|uniref:Protein NIM1-INTERACTING 2 n=1 Tax=Theobroma cacao TaxID=3641 RepID=A0AB32VKI9_THECC|nr:PREDICTED: protein NIM1-INTERACTING 2 [Theobroma cacao]